jgi:hypothetical protein
LDLCLAIISAEPLDYSSTGIGTAGILEMRYTGEGLLAERGKLIPDEGKIDGVGDRAFPWERHDGMIAAQSEPQL